MNCNVGLREMDTQFKKGVLELCVLSLLDKKDCYGYEIVNVISKRISISEGTVYPLLRRLKDDGYVTTYLKESQEGPPRKYYRITKEGRRMNRLLTKEWLNFSAKVNAFFRGVKDESETVFGRAPK